MYQLQLWWSLVAPYNLQRFIHFIPGISLGNPMYIAGTIAGNFGSLEIGL